MPVAPEIRARGTDGEIEHTTLEPSRAPAEAVERRSTPRMPIDGDRQMIKVYPFGISWNRVEDAARGLGMPVAVVREPEDADVVITLKNYYRRKTPRLRDAESNGVPIYVARSNSTSQIASALTSVFALRRGPEEDALDEPPEAIEAGAARARGE